MYKCGACGGIIEELGEMAVASGGCVCAQEKSEESAQAGRQKMTLQEQFEKEYYERPCSPYMESENSEQWARVLAWQEGYSEWLETLLQSGQEKI